MKLDSSYLMVTNGSDQISYDFYLFIFMFLLIKKKIYFNVASKVSNNERN
jgi:hypothetical protein